MEISGEIWVSCSFSQSGLDGSSELVKEVHPDLSLVECIVLAMALDWAYLVILGVTRGCTLYEINAYAVGAVARDSIGGDSRCKTPDRVIGCERSNQYYPVGHVLETKDVCGVLRDNICNDEGIFYWQESTPYPPQLTSCIPPFEQVASVGCIYVDTDCWIRIRDNEPLCLHKGAKMASPKTITDFMALKDYLTSDFGGGDHFHAGAEYSEGEGAWVWMYHGRRTDPKEWDEPTTSTTGSLELAPWTDYKLKIRTDDSYKNLLCIADLQ